MDRLTRGPGDGTRRVLVVDDNVELAENIVELLQLAGYVAQLAGSAEEAIPKALAEDVEFIVTDFRLPGLDGAELITKLRGQGRKIRAVIMSAYSDEGTLSAAHRAGIDDFIPKPVDFARLTRILGGPELP